MHEEDLKMMKQVEEILSKELRAELKKIVDAGQFAPGQTKTLTDAVCLMLKMRECQDRLNEDSQGYSSFRMNTIPAYGAYGHYPTYATGYTMNPMTYGYPGNYSGHSTRDRMVSCLEDLMGEAKNEYEAKMISDAIRYVQNGEGR